MTKTECITYFKDVIKSNGTFDINNWVTKDGYPCIYESGFIKNNIKLSDGELRQSLYMAGGTTIHMGIMDYDRTSGDLDVDLNYVFQSQSLTISFNDIMRDTKDEYVYMDSDEMGILDVVTKLYTDEAQYFQDSTVLDLPFSFEEQNEIKNFFDEIRFRFYDHKVNLR